MKKWFDTDTFREILDSILRNRSRSLLTGFGVFWGVFMLMLLTGGGQGLKQILMNEFDGFAQNTCIVFADQTSKPYKGFKKGRSWNMNYADLDRLRNLVPELETITPVVSLWGKSVSRNDNTSSSAVVKGARADYANIETPRMMYGRYLNDSDNAQERKVCVLGKKVYDELFPEGGDPSALTAPTTVLSASTGKKAAASTSTVGRPMPSPSPSTRRARCITWATAYICFASPRRKASP